MLPLSSGLARKLLLVVAGSHLLAAFAVGFTLGHQQRENEEQRFVEQLRVTAAVLRSHSADWADVLSGRDEASDPDRARELDRVVRDLARLATARITLIDAAGTVVADSTHDPRYMLDHTNRPELVEARRHGEGVSIRPSPTLGGEWIYFATSLGSLADDAPRAFLRVATRAERLHARVAAVRRQLWFLVLGIAGAASLVAAAVIARLTKPLGTLRQAVYAVADGTKSELPILSRSGEVGSLADSFRRIQERHAEQVARLRAGTDQLTTVLSSMDDGIIAVDADERILFANEACRRMLDFAPGEAMRRPLLEATRNRPLHDVVRNALGSGQPVGAEFVSQGRPRRSLSVRANCIPGEPCPGVVVLLHDVSELRRLENLRQEFVANVSHELKTPLAAIKAYAETLRLGAVNDRDNNLGFVARIEEQADRLQDLILDMLQIARIESGQEAFEMRNVDLERVVHSSVENHRETADRAGVRIEVQDDPSPAVVRADEDGLYSILDNLIDNAIKYTAAGGRVRVGWKLDDQFAQLEVEDSGIGIAPEEQGRVFERFFRSDRARSRELGSTGLGLSIVKHLSLAFGGSVELESQPGVGSTFRVFLPRAD